MRKKITWMVQIPSNVTGTIRIFHRRHMLHDTVEEDPAWSGMLSPLTFYQDIKSGYIGMLERACLLTRLSLVWKWLDVSVIPHGHPECPQNKGLFIANSFGPSSILEWVAREISRNEPRFQIVYDLREAIFATWNNIPASLLQRLISTMPKRFLELFTMTTVLLTTKTSCWVFSTLFRTSFRHGLKLLTRSHLA